MIQDKGKKGLDVDELLEALKTIELLGSATREAQAVGSASQGKGEDPLNKVVDDLQKTRIRAKPKAKRKEHWKRKLMKRRARGRRNDLIIRTRRKAEWAERLQGKLTEDEVRGLTENEVEKLREAKLTRSWYDWLARKSNNGWTKRKGWEISFADFEEYVWPKLRHNGELRVPTSHRIDTKKNWTLGNVRWYDNATRQLLADGSELYLQKKGYTTNDEAPAPDYSEDEGWMT